MEEISERLPSRHVIVNCDHSKAVRAERLENRSDLGVQHGDIARDFSVRVRSIEAHHEVE